VTLPFDLELPAALWLAAVLAGAAFVRGYSGFGFAALVVSAAGLVTDPLHPVPVVLICDLAMAFQMVPGLRGNVDWSRTGALTAGAVLGVPFGLWAITGAATDTARAVIAGFILVMCAILLAGWRFARDVGRLGTFVAGVVSGIANAAAVGGLPVAAFFAAQPLSARQFRATLIAYFVLLDLWSVPLMWRAGLIGADTLKAVLLALPFIIFGNWAGGRHFLRADPQSFRRMAIGLLAVLAALGLLKSAFA
jgi:uncharacterized protein